MSNTSKFAGEGKSSKQYIVVVDSAIFDGWRSISDYYSSRKKAQDYREKAEDDLVDDDNIEVWSKGKWELHQEIGKDVSSEELDVIIAILKLEGETGTTKEQISNKTGISKNQVNKLVQNLLDKDQLYEPIKGRFKCFSFGRNIEELIC